MPRRARNSENIKTYRFQLNIEIPEHAALNEVLQGWTESGVLSARVRRILLQAVPIQASYSAPVPPPAPITLPRAAVLGPVSPGPRQAPEQEHHVRIPTVRRVGQWDALTKEERAAEERRIIQERLKREGGTNSG